MSFSERVFTALIKRDHSAEAEMPTEARANLPQNGLRQILANTLQSSGDQTVNASTVLPWIFATLGVPGSLTGLLVPIRESLSMLPQAFLTPLILRAKKRKRVYIAGALTQSVAVAGMAATAALAEGLAAGVLILAFLTVFSLGRSLGSITSKDVQGRTIPKGERGQINGVATTASGLVAITLGLLIRIFGAENLTSLQLALILTSGSILWLLISLVYSGVKEPDEETTPKKGLPREAKSETTEMGWLQEMMLLLQDDKNFRSFVTTRSLLLVSALSPPFFVTMSIRSGSHALAGLGGFVIAAGLASLIGGRIFGRFADSSSKRLMSFGASLASAIILGTLLIVSLPFFDGKTWFANLLFIVVYFLLTLTHTGVRVGRKTYVTDMAEGNLRTKYVAVSNSAMGFILLIVGALSSALAIYNLELALIFLALLGILGAFSGAKLPDVSRGKRA